MPQINKNYTGTKDGIQIEVECDISADISVKQTIGGSFDGWDFEVIRETTVTNIQANIIGVWKKVAGNTNYPSCNWVDFPDYEEEKIKAFLAKQMAADEEELINEFINQN